ncbi:cyclic 3',5'-adenosine monophosphate phosphodiesterase [Posidoniimonas polymericola]|uniref:Cyclic 3',5'-adenosine monophosphate phosphodiesterase n=1 Tax=Posidoniimonas polymericola TaxID=2528002 RepID=A0A5C5YSK8_9BACT|nr:metallophosphoesterase [Posidoniimonas polymericola]TWT77939.1 cyclic 3',5'-adenosine monophosphate phosphodiesterase [Posidoniimonas polymericola]
MPRTAILLWLLLIAVCPILSAHPGPDHQHDEPSSEAQPRLPKAMALPELSGPTPWSDKPVLDDPERFQIAIMTDRTGGHRPGIWMDAVNKLNMLRPQFVMSVGDLIEGYSQNREQVEGEWDEFLGFIDQMQMKFFFVAGNHDLTNPMMHELWRKHFGAEWYSFDYQRVHFVCLSSEDPVDKIGDEQIAWLSKDLEEHRDAKWTLVFLHKPLWIYAERDLRAGNPDSTNWKQAEQLLVDRPHTIFAGHVHHYVEYQRNEQKYYSLATTGGGSMLRGNEYGEFDHVMWLTMEPDGPHLVNLRLDGILEPGVVNEKGINRFNRFLERTTVAIDPILIESQGDGFSEGEVVLKVANEFNEPITVKGEIDGLPLRGLTVDPLTIDLEVAPNDAVEQRIRIRFAEQVDFSSLSRTTLTATVRSSGDNPLLTERTSPVVIDRRFELPGLAELPAIDGQVEAWPETSEQTADKPLVLEAPLAWQGPNDASAKFFARHVGDRVYVAVQVKDDRVLAAGDRVELLIDPRGLAARVQDPSYMRTGLSISAYAPTAGGETRVDAHRLNHLRPYNGVDAAASLTDDGYVVEFSIPVRLFKEIQGKTWESVQGNLVIHDADDEGETPAQVLWRGSDRVREINTGFGQFVKE